MAVTPAAFTAPALTSTIGACAHTVDAIAEATRDVFHGMAIALAIAFVVALKFMPAGKVEEGEVPEDESVLEAA